MRRMHRFSVSYKSEEPIITCSYVVFLKAPLNQYHFVTLVVCRRALGCEFIVAHPLQTSCLCLMCSRDGFFVDQSEFILRWIPFVAKVDGKSNNIVQLVQVEEKLKLDLFIV